MRRLVLVIAVVISIAGVTHAGPKKRGTALAASAIGVGVSSAVMVSSFFIGVTNQEDINAPLFYAGLGSSLVTPSLGQWYAHQWLSYGMLVRAAGVAVGTIALRAGREQVTCDTATTSQQKCAKFTAAGILLLGVAATAYVGGAAYDVDDAPDAADRYNHEHGLILVPTMSRGIGGEPIAGLSLGGVF